MKASGRVCRFYASGTCKNGANCNFEHPQGGFTGTQGPMPVNRNTGYEKPTHSGSKPSGSICNFFLQGKCNKQNCT